MKNNLSSPTLVYKNVIEATVTATRTCFKKISKHCIHSKQSLCFKINGTLLQWTAIDDIKLGLAWRNDMFCFKNMLSKNSFCQIFNLVSNFLEDIQMTIIGSPEPVFF